MLVSKSNHYLKTWEVLKTDATFWKILILAGGTTNGFPKFFNSSYIAGLVD